MRIGILSLGLVVLGLLASACDVQVNEKGMSVDLVEGKASDEWSRTYTLPRDGQLEIVNSLGSIEVFPATGAAIEVLVRREVRSRSDEAAQEILKGLKIEEEISPSRVVVRSQRANELRGFMQSVRFNYRVNVPAGLTATVTTENGNVQIDNVQGTLSANSTNGSITGRGVSGPFHGRTVNGRIVLELQSVAGEVSLSTVNGPIRIALPIDANADLQANSVNGGVSVDETLVYKATERERTRVAGQLNAGGPKIILDATNGPIRIGPSLVPGRSGEPQLREPVLRERRGRREP
jgi:hypothetical protein